MLLPSCWLQLKSVESLIDLLLSVFRLCCTNLFSPLTHFPPPPLRVRRQSPGGAAERCLTGGRTRRTPAAQTNPAGGEGGAADGGEPGAEAFALQSGRPHRFCVLCLLSVHYHSFPDIHVRGMDTPGFCMRLRCHSDI